MEFLAGFVNKFNQVFALLLVLLLGWVLGFGWISVDKIAADASLWLTLLDLSDGGEKGVIIEAGYFLFQVNDNWIGVGKTHTGWFDIPVAIYAYLGGLIYTLFNIFFSWSPSIDLEIKIAKQLDPILGEVDEEYAAKKWDHQKEYEEHILQHKTLGIIVLVCILLVLLAATSGVFYPDSNVTSILGINIDYWYYATMGVAVIGLLCGVFFFFFLKETEFHKKNINSAAASDEEKT